MNIFKSFPVRKPKGNLFNLTHEKKLSFNMGELIPMYLQDVVPGDRFMVNSEVFLRMAPMLAPIMHRVNVFVHFFFVAKRLLWPADTTPATTGWEAFITGGTDGTLEPTFPTDEIEESNKSYFTAGKLPDYLGLPVTDGLTITQNLTYSRLPFYAYQMIWNEYYRDPNLTTEINPIAGSHTVHTVLRNRCWEKDYFTSALPWSQRGGDVNLPIEGEIEFEPEYAAISTTVKNSTSGAMDVGTIKSDGSNLTDVNNAAGRIENLESSTTYELDNVVLTVNDLRQSVKLQQWLENNARGGGRYIEQNLAHFGVMSSDARLQRPEYLGGGKAPVVVSEVLSAAESTNYDVGDMFGHGVSVGRTNSFNKFFEEHGYIMGIVSVMPRTAYQQGVERHWLKTDKFDYYFPEFANLGEQEIFNQELYHDFEGSDDAQDTFGYQSRYAEYKFKPSSVHGDFKDDLTMWHLGRIFSATPELNTSFVELDHTTAGVHRIHVVTGTGYDKIYGQIINNVKAWRPMPKFGIPRL